MEPELVARYVETYRAERARLEKLHAKDRREIGEIKRRLAKVMESIETDDGELSELLPRQHDLAAKRRELKAKLPLADKPS